MKFARVAQDDGITHMNISRRAKNTPPSATRKLVPLANEARARGITIYYTHIGQPDLTTPTEILDGFRNLSFPTLKYAPSSGMPETVAAWQTYYRKKGISFDKQQIVVTSGGAEGLIFAFFAICDPGDELLVFEPFYTSYATIAAMGNINLHPVMTTFENGFHLPTEKEIVKAINPKTRGIVLCNPNNPTGTLYGKEETMMLAKIAQKHNLFIISDETYQEIVFDGKRVVPFSTISGISDRLIIVDSVSKRLNACGARVGSVASHNDDIMAAVLRFAQGRLSVATVDQLAVIPMLVEHEAYIRDITAVYQRRRDTLLRCVRNIPGASVFTPEGAFYMIVRLPIDDSDAFARFLLTDFADSGETVMVAPATGFYATSGKGKNEIRLAYVLEEKKLERAMELLGKAIKEYNKKLKQQSS